MIRLNTGSERILSFLTGLRGSTAAETCDQPFRAQDRRQIPREVNSAAIVPKQLLRM